MNRLLALILTAFSLLAVSCQTSAPIKPDKSIHVTIGGAVESPKSCLIPPDTKVDELIKFAGGYARRYKEESYAEIPAGLTVLRGEKRIRIPFREWKSKKWETFRFLDGDKVIVDIWVF